METRTYNDSTRLKIAPLLTVNVSILSYCKCGGGHQQVGMKKLRAISSDGMVLPRDISAWTFQNIRKVLMQFCNVARSLNLTSTNVI